MEEQFRKIVREEITRALGAVADVAESVWDAAEVDSAEAEAAQVLRRTLERVARDVLANLHPAAGTEHTASTPPVHTITVVPERPKAACTCSRHKHVMGNNDACGHPGCFCVSPLRARTDEHTGTPKGVCPCGHSNRDHRVTGNQTRCAWCPCTTEHASTDVPDMCRVCEHGEHARGQCSRHVYVDGVARACRCSVSSTPRAQRARTSEHTSTPVTKPCSYCLHVHGGTAADCDVPVGKYVCPCPFAGGRP